MRRAAKEERRMDMEQERKRDDRDGEALSRENRRHCVLIALMCGLMAMVSLGMSTNAYGVFYSPVSAALGVSRGSVSIHQALSAIASGLGSPLVIRLAKRYPLKYITAAGSCMVGAAYCLMAVSTRLWMFNLLGILRGMGCACFFLTVITTLLGNWFTGNLGTVTGVVLSFSGISGAVFSPVLTALIQSQGYKTTYVLCGILSIVALLPGSLSVLSLTPEERGMRPSGGAVRTRTAAPVGEEGGKLRLGSFCFIACCCLSCFAAFSAGMTHHMPGFSEQLRYGAGYGALLVSCVMIGNITSKFIAGVLCDRIGVFRTFSIVILVSMLGVATLMISPSHQLVLAAAAVLFGFINAVSAIGISALVRAIYGNTRYSEVFSALSAVSCIVSAFATTIIGYMYDFFRTYQYSFITIAVLDTICLLLIATLKRTQGMGACQQRAPLKI